MIQEKIAATELPLVPHLPAICKALDENGAAVLRADPGSGKSTLVPLALMDYFNGKIIMLEPRRAAVLGIVSRLAELLEENIGGRAGYSVRLERRVSAQTRIEVITEGLLVRRIQENPSMFEGNREQTSWTIIFDEFHERSIHTDLAFAFVLDLRRMGVNIRLLLMSATLDAGKAAARVDEACPGSRTAILECPGRVFPVETCYYPLPRKALDRECAAALAAILREESISGTHTGDILVFLPGRREIAACAGQLKDQGLDRDFEIEILHGSLPLERQRRIIAPPQGRGRRVVLATNVAETGLTIPGIGLVIDSGYVRLQRFHIPSGMNRLTLEPASGDSTDQRAGRAGRLGPGRCIRLWAEGEYRPRQTPAEITRIDILAAVLECLLWGARNTTDLPWLEQPLEAAWNRALELLMELEAVNADYRPAETGRIIARLGLEPRLGRLCIAGRDLGMAGLACTVAALLSEKDDSGLTGDPDFAGRLSRLRLMAGTSWARRIKDSASDLIKRLGLSLPPEWAAEDEADAGELLARAFPDRIAKRRDEGIFRFPSGREGRVNAPFTNAQWLCALEVDSGERMGFIRLALPVSEQTALSVLEKHTFTEKTIEWKGLVPRLIRTKKAGRIPLGEERTPCRRDELLPSLPVMLKERGLSVLPWNDNRGEAQQLLERIRFFVTHNSIAVNGNELARWNDELLANEASDWLGSFVWNGGETGKGDIIDTDGLCGALINRLGWEEKREMDKLVPGYFTVSSGRKRHIEYGSGEPVIRLRLQDAFGITGQCAVLGVPIVFHLLSPADRPVQITRDLNGFWAGSWAEIRKEMRGRYPKHRWPENPQRGE